MRCDQAKWFGPCKQSRYFLCFLLFLQHFNFLYLWNPLINFNGVCCKMKFSKMYTIIWSTNENWIWLTSDSFCLILSNVYFYFYLTLYTVFFFVAFLKCMYFFKTIFCSWWERSGEFWKLAPSSGGKSGNFEKKIMPFCTQR